MDEKTEQVEQAKRFVVVVDDKGSIKVDPQNMSADEVTGVVLRLAAQMRQRLGM